ncbi:hypothetical protein [Streptomyces antimicrobicus]|uniref:YCII-related domain-containing protein n=1 Tax=Streptomyces antimicrobicus TaxID=2883108 RepID=A0ABS8B8V2_9ACTN|nr:hypothetical protein [Streptomyces antimicrobicus]MCB5181046.1 hypothetical protein [Streptomyces antimicrobicus]
MYLIHAQLRGPCGAPLPYGAARQALDLARPEERVEHVSAHPLAVPHPVLGFFLMAGSLSEAEGRVAQVCLRLLRESDELAGWVLHRAEAPLVAPLGQGLLGPLETSSEQSDLRRK